MYTTTHHDTELMTVMSHFTGERNPILIKIVGKLAVIFILNICIDSFVIFRALFFCTRRLDINLLLLASVSLI